MQRSPSCEASSHSASEKIFPPLWKYKVGYHVYRCLSLVLILSHMNPAHILYFSFKIHFNIILPNNPMSPKDLFPSGFDTNILCKFLLSPLRANGPSISSFLI